MEPDRFDLFYQRLKEREDTAWEEMSKIVAAKIRTFERVWDLHLEGIETGTFEMIRQEALLLLWDSVRKNKIEVPRSLGSSYPETAVKFRILTFLRSRKKDRGKLVVDEDKGDCPASWEEQVSRLMENRGEEVYQPIPFPSRVETESVLDFVLDKIQSLNAKCQRLLRIYTQSKLEREGFSSQREAARFLGLKTSSYSSAVTRCLQRLRNMSEMDELRAVWSGSR